MPIRHRLAHRYLRENLNRMKAAHDAGIKCVPEMAAEMLEWSLRFGNSENRLNDATLAIQAAFRNEQPAPPQEFREHLEKLSRTVMEGRPFDDPLP